MKKKLSSLCNIVQSDFRKKIEHYQKTARKTKKQKTKNVFKTNVMIDIFQ